MSEITVRLRKRWANNEEGLVKRIARIVGHSDEFVCQQTTGYKWSLNYQGNDWWASGICTDAEGQFIKVAYRYGTDDLMAALKTLLIWVVQ